MPLLLPELLICFAKKILPKGILIPMTGDAGRLWTVGHSSRSFDELVALLREHEIETLVDVRTVPRSRRFPQFDRDALAQRLPRRRIDYRHHGKLGGRRVPEADSPHVGLREPAMRGYADFMSSERFEPRLQKLLNLTRAGRVAVMCAEGDPWHCHRSLLSDALAVRGWKVTHILAPGKAMPHRMHPHARVEGTLLGYPGLDGW